MRVAVTTRQGPSSPGPSTRKRISVSDLQALADRVEIEALRGELTDAVMMRDYDRLASLFTPDGVVRVPHINAEAVGREQLRAGASGCRVSWTISCRRRTQA